MVDDPSDSTNDVAWNILNPSIKGLFDLSNDRSACPAESTNPKQYHSSITMSFDGATHSLLATMSLALTIAVSPTVAQASTNSSMEGCGMRVQNIVSEAGAFKSTRSTVFRLDGQDEWHLSYGPIDQRRENLIFGPWVSMQTLATFLSVPESFIGSQRGNQTNYCVYLMHDRNETSDTEPGDGNPSCSGELDDECITALQQAPPPTDCSYPRVDTEDACGSSSRIFVSKIILYQRLFSTIYRGVLRCVRTVPGLRNTLSR